MEASVREERTSIFLIYKILGKLCIEPVHKAKGHPVEVLPRVQPSAEGIPVIVKAPQSHLIPRRLEINRPASNRQLEDLQRRSIHPTEESEHILTSGGDKVDIDDKRLAGDTKIHQQEDTGAVPLWVFLQGAAVGVRVGVPCDFGDYADIAVHAL